MSNEIQMENRNENDEGIPGAKPPVALSEGSVPETRTGFAASTIADAEFDARTATPEQVDAYLRSEGIDPDEEREHGRKVIERLKRIVNEAPNTMRPRPIIDQCDQGHTFAKLPDHPMRDGKPRCPHCLATGLDLSRDEVDALNAVIHSMQRR